MARRRILDHDSGLMRALAWMVDVIEINALMILTSLPIITIGASLAAGYNCIYRLNRGEGTVAANYWRAFRMDFRQGTLLWLLFAPIGAALVWAWIAVRLTPLLVLEIAFSIIWLLGLQWIWALVALFKNSCGAMAKNAFLFGLTHIGTTIGLLAVDTATVLAWWAAFMYFPQGLFLLAVFGIGLVVAFKEPLVEHALAKFL